MKKILMNLNKYQFLLKVTKLHFLYKLERFYYLPSSLVQIPCKFWDWPGTYTVAVTADLQGYGRSTSVATK